VLLSHVSLSRIKNYCYIKILLCQIYLPDNIKTYLRFYIRFPIICPILTKFVVSAQTFMQVPSIKFTQVL